jgi:transposase-like protein
MDERLIAQEISPMEVIHASKELVRAVDTWRERDLSEGPVKYMNLDGTLFSVRRDGSEENSSVKLVSGVTE